MEGVGAIVEEEVESGVMISVGRGPGSAGGVGEDTGGRAGSTGGESWRCGSGMDLVG